MRLWTRLYGTGLNVSANVIQPSTKYTIVLSGTPRAAEPNGNGKTAHTVTCHSGDVCDQVPVAGRSNYGAELTYGVGL